MLEQRYEIHFFERLQKRFEDIVTQCWSGFFCLPHGGLSPIK